VPIDPKAKKPDWLKVRIPGGDRFKWIKEQRTGGQLATVCEEARCPNIGECWGCGTATFMVLGSVCTRGCRFCAVTTRKQGNPVDVDEPAKLAATIAAMDLDYIVLTSVDRDDLPDEGAGHFADCVRAVREASPKTRIEILHPDFSGRDELIDVVARSGADVLGHNVEVVRRLTATVRDPRCDYDQSLRVLARVKQTTPSALTKSSLMVGVGETEDEVLECMRELRAVGVELLTVGQYLRPSRKHMPVEAWIPPAQFERYEQLGLELGFAYVASGPLVRSSYKAGEFFIQGLLDQRDRGQPLASKLAAGRRLRVLPS
jgi:lipoyl synthase